MYDLRVNVSKRTQKQFYSFRIKCDHSLEKKKQHSIFILVPREWGVEVRERGSASKHDWHVLFMEGQ